VSRDKVYSRRRIRLPNFNFLREISSFKIILLIMFFTILIILGVFLYTAYPVFKTTCETAAASKGTKIINDEVTNVMKQYSYDSLIRIEKDVNGKISFIEANSSKINEIVSQIISNIQKEFDGIPRITIFLNMGSVSGISVLKNWDPKFEIELESAGNIDAKVKSEFESVGINQTRHKVYLQIDASVGILTPVSTFSKEINTDVLLTEAIIVGEVPEAYYNLGEMDEVEDSYNFLKQ
jgi:sporulation protein YunB